MAVPTVQLRFDERGGSFPHAIVTTATKLTFLVKRDGDSPFLRAHSPCCSLRLSPLEDRVTWLCSGCKRSVIQSPKFYPDCHFKQSSIEAYLLSVAQVYYDPLTAVVVVAELLPELEAYFAQP